MAHNTGLRSQDQKWLLACLAGIVVYVLIDIVLTALRHDYNWLHNAESDYGRGPYFWLMDINFLLRGFFSLALVKVLLNNFSKFPPLKQASYSLGLWAISSGLLAFFADDPQGYPKTWSGPIHLLLAATAFISALVGMYLFNRNVSFIPLSERATYTLTSLTAIAVIAILLLGHAGFHPHSLGGLYERIFLGCVIAWEGVLAFNLLSSKYVASK